MMSRESLLELLEHARREVVSDPDARLSRPTRHRMWTVLGAAKDPQGWKQRATLAIGSARRVLALWQAEFPEDELAAATLTTAEGVADQRLTRELGEKAWERLRSFLEDLDEPESVANETNAGFACAQALRAALSDEILDEPEVTDDDLDYEQWDAAYYACCAEAGDEGQASNVARRRAFWDWYLGEWARIALGEALGT